MSAPSESSAPVITAPVAPTPPAWVRGYLTRQQPSPLTLLSAKVPAATSLSAEGLSDAVAGAYRAILGDLRAHQRHAVRMWNFVPSIHGELGAGDRYMAFNAGRFAAFAESFDLSDTDASTIPTASAVGIDGTTLWIHVLASDVPGMAVENPRQMPAYRYSKRYGLRPPCFARATRFESTLLIGGTHRRRFSSRRGYRGADAGDAIEPAFADRSGYGHLGEGCAEDVARRSRSRHQRAARACRA
jgi:hypothetical protein